MPTSRRSHRPLVRTACLAIGLLLAGCAAQTAFREGQALVREGRAVEAQERLEEAARLDPASMHYRVALAYARERAAAQRLAQADALARQDQLDAAERLLRQVVSADPSQEPAWQRLRELDRRRRIATRMDEAGKALSRQDTAAAQAALLAVLAEDASHEPARRQLAELEQARGKGAAEGALAEAYRKPITIEFRDAPLRSVFELISRTSGLNFLFDKDVRTDQKMSIFLKNATIESAVQLALLTNQLEQRVVDAHTVLIYPNTQAKQKDYQPLVVRSFFLANAEAKAVAATLKTLLKSRDLVVDDKLNLLILRDSPEAVRLAEKLVALHDVPEPEVMLEVEILEVKRTRLLDLGIRWPDQLVLTPLPSASGGPLTVADLRGINGRSLGASIGPLSISARKVDSDANILANPRIRARNREKAKILIGERVPNITTTSTSTGFVAESVTYVDVGLKLDVEPTIYPDGEVAIRVALEVSNIISQLQTKSGSVAYQIGTRSAQTVLRLKDGENQVLAGLINDEDRRSANKVPGLGEVPLVGRLFGGQADDSSKTEIVLSITPRVLRNVRRPVGALAEFDAGTENSLSLRPTGVTGPVAPAAAPASTPAVPTMPVIPVVPAIPVAPPAPDPAATAIQPSMPVSPATAPLPIPPDPAAAPAPTDTTTGSAGPMSLQWQGPSELKAGEAFALGLALRPDQPVQSIALTLGFDARLLQVVSVSEGDFLRQGGSATSFTSRVDPSGRILLTTTRAASTGASAPGTLATVQWRVVGAGAGESGVQVLGASPLGPGGRAIALAPPPPHPLRLSGAAPPDPRAAP